MFHHRCLPRGWLSWLYMLEDGAKKAWLFDCISIDCSLSSVVLIRDTRRTLGWLGIVGLTQWQGSAAGTYCGAWCWQSCLFKGPSHVVKDCLARKTSNTPVNEPWSASLWPALTSSWSYFNPRIKRDVSGNAFMSLFFPVFSHDPLGSPEIFDLLFCSPACVQGETIRAAQWE